MILLSDNFMFFKLPSGESVPFSAEMISVELADGAGHPFDQAGLSPAGCGRDVRTSGPSPRPL